MHVCMDVCEWWLDMDMCAGVLPAVDDRQHYPCWEKPTKKNSISFECMLYLEHFWLFTLTQSTLS